MATGKVKVDDSFRDEYKVGTFTIRRLPNGGWAVYTKTWTAVGVYEDLGDAFDYAMDMLNLF